MTLEDKINVDLKSAMKAKDAIALRGIRAIKAAILLAKTDGSGKELNEETEIKLLQKLIKQRKDSLEIYEKQNRGDLAQTEKEEIGIIEKYLPEQLSPEELTLALQNIIQKVGASTIKDLGKVMGVATKELSGKADGKTISTLLKNLLA
jgi:uncharacterized protein YqeY